MSNGFKKGVSLLVTAGLLASLAATAFAGTAAATVTPLGTTANVPGNQAYTALPSTTLTLNGLDDIMAAVPGDSVRFVVGNGFELNPAANITVSRDQGPLLFGSVGPGATSIVVNAVTTPTASYFDVPIWNSSGDTTVANTIVTFSGIQVRQRAGAAAAGAIVTIDNNSAHPGAAVTNPTVFTLYTLNGTVGAELPKLSCFPDPIVATALGDGVTLPASGYTTCTATGTGRDWAGNASGGALTAGAWVATTAYALNATVQPTAPNGHQYKAIVAGTSGAAEPIWPTNGGTVVDGTVTWTDLGASFIPANSTITATGPGALGASPANPTAARSFWGQVAGVYTATVMSGAPTPGLTATDTFTIVAGPLAQIVVQDVNGNTSGSLAVGDSLQFIAICQDQFGNEIARTGDNGYRPWNCDGIWSDSPHPGAAEINNTGLLTGLRLGQIDAVIYTIGSISGQSGPWQIVSGPATSVLGNAVPGSPFNQASPIIRAGGFGSTTAAYTYSEPEFLPDTFPPISGSILFPIDGFTWTIDISDAQGNRRVHFDTSVAPGLVGPDSLDFTDPGCGAWFLNDYTLQVTSCSSNPLQIEQLTVQGLKVKADANAALGNIRTRYMLSTSRFTFGGNGANTAYAFIDVLAALPGTAAFGVVDFSGIILPTQGDVGQLNFSDASGLAALACMAFGCPATESVNVITATPPNPSDVQILVTSLRTKPHAIGTLVWQDQGSLSTCEGVLPTPAGIHNYGRCALPSIGTVVDSLKLTSSAPTVQRGLPNRLPFGTVGIEERTTGAEGNGSSSGLLAAGTVISLTLDSTQGVVFSEPPTAQVTWTKAGAIGWICSRLQKPLIIDAQPFTDGCVGVAHGALVIPYVWLPTTADFGPTADNRGKFFINDDPWTFENRTAVVPTDNTAATVSPSTYHDHAGYTMVGQDVFGAALSDLGSGQAPLTLYNSRTGGIVNPLDYNTNVYVADLSPDRLTATFKVRTTDVGLVTSKILVDGYIDVSAAATAGGPVTLSVSTGSGTAAAAKVSAAASSIPVVPGSVTIGTINNTVDGTAQAIPSVIIGANDQATGTVVIREAAAGMLGATALSNVLRVCYVSQTGKPEVFTRAPWLVVTAGDLKLRANSDPSIPSGAAAAGTGVRGYIGVGGTYCAQWIVSNFSTTASTLEIRGSATDGSMLPAGPNNGPKVNVDPQQVPGPVTLSLWQLPLDQWSIGSVPYSGTQFDLVQNAVRVYGANVAVAAVSQPEIRKGKINQPAGDVTITESATFQLGNYSWWLGGVQQAIWFQIVPNNVRDVLPSIYFNTDRVAPVVSTNSAESGLIASFGRWFNNTTFTVVTQQRAFVPVAGSWVPGKITVSGLAYSATNDAALGPVQLQVCSTGNMRVSSPSDFAVCPGVQTGLFVAAENAANFNQVVSNAKVVEDSSILGAIAPGVAGPGTNRWTFNTVMVLKNHYVTLRLQAVKGAVVGDRIEIWGRAGKTGTWKKLTTRLVGANGYVFYFKKISGYTEFQAYFAGSDTAAASYAVPRYYRATVGTAKQVAAWNKKVKYL